MFHDSPRASESFFNEFKVFELLMEIFGSVLVDVSLTRDDQRLIAMELVLIGFSNLER